MGETEREDHSSLSEWFLNQKPAGGFGGLEPQEAFSMARPSKINVGQWAPAGDAEILA